VRQAGGEPIPLPVADFDTVREALPGLDAFILPGNPADIDPRAYGATNQGLSFPDDSERAQADRVVLEHAFAEKKPVLGICYGCQLLNVYLGGTLIQDLHTETGTTTPHRKGDVSPALREDPIHGVSFEPDSRLAALAQQTPTEINSSHHQAIAQLGRNLRVTARSVDGTVEGIEWTGDSQWVMGVQWHPERMPADELSKQLFADFITAAIARRETAGVPIPAETT
jgi:putative glutamine amidotransferase